MVTTERKDPSAFGRYLRACRLGFHWSERHRAYIRMSDAGPGRTMIMACGRDAMPAGVPRGFGEYRCWWERPERGDPCLTTMVAPLERIAEAGGLGPHESRQWFIGDDGEEIK